MFQYIPPTHKVSLRSSFVSICLLMVPLWSFFVSLCLVVSTCPASTLLPWDAGNYMCNSDQDYNFQVNEGSCPNEGSLAFQRMPSTPGQYKVVLFPYIPPNEFGQGAGYNPTVDPANVLAEVTVLQVPPTSPTMIK